MLFSVPCLDDGPAEQVNRSDSADTPRLFVQVAKPACTMDCVLCSLVVRKAERRGKVGHMDQAGVRGMCA